MNYRLYPLFLILVMAGCADRDKVSGEDIPADSEDPPAGWRLASYNRDRFRFHVPPDMENIPVQGIDSLVGKFESPNITLTFDYGGFSGGLFGEKPEEEQSRLRSQPDFELEELRIDGYPAEIMTYRNPDGGISEQANIINLKVTELSESPNWKTSLRMTAQCRSIDDYETARRIFSSIRFSRNQE